MSESTRDAALKVIAEAFNTGHDPTSPEYPQLEKVHRHDGHKFCSACWVCMGDAEKLTAHIADALAGAGLLRTPSPSAASPEPTRYCSAMIWPTWAPKWLPCGSAIQDGKCLQYGHNEETEAHRG